MTVEEFMRSVDPSYGRQTHQREFISRMMRAQAIAPCAVDHDVPETLPSGRGVPRCHRASCYPTDSRGRMVGD